MTDKVQKIRKELDRLKLETPWELSGHSNYEAGIIQGRMEIIEALSSFIDSLQEETKPKVEGNPNAKKPTLVIRKGEKYMCIKDYHDKNCTFTKGKIYQSDKDFFLVDDEDELTFERKIWEDDACEYFCNVIQEEPEKCMYAQPNYTNGDRLVLCKDCNELCKYNQKTAAE